MPLHVTLACSKVRESDRGKEGEREREREREREDSVVTIHCYILRDVGVTSPIKSTSASFVTPKTPLGLKEYGCGAWRST